MNEAKKKRLQLLAECDEEYKSQKVKFLSIEKAFLETVHHLPDHQQDLIWEFVFASNELDGRLLEIACDYIPWDG